MHRFIIGFILGAAGGGIGSYLYLKKDFENRLDSAIEDTKLYYEGKLIEVPKDEEDKPVEPVHEEVVEEPVEDEEVNDSNRTPYNKAFNPEVAPVPEVKKSTPKAKPRKKKGIEVISAQEFIRNPQPEQISLTYFSDGDMFMLDSTEEIYPEGYDVIGKEPLTHFGEEEEGVVYVRNHNNGTDYDVTLNEDMTYEEYCR